MAKHYRSYKRSRYQGVIAPIAIPATALLTAVLIKKVCKEISQENS